MIPLRHRLSLLTSCLLALGSVSFHATAQDEPAGEHDHDHMIDDVIAPPPPATPDFAESPAEPSIMAPEPPAMALGAVAPAARQPAGSLSGKIVFTNGGHGWTWDPAQWRLQRGVTQEMNEDYGNADQFNLFATYCFNAGAVVVPMRPLGHQTNEVVLDNDDADVTWAGTWFDSTSSIFYGKSGDVPYRYAALSAAETATATYTPNIPAAGVYPVYTWVRHGSDRGWQLYRIRHTGGESQIRIPHHMVGNGWVYLGEYSFNAGSNAATGSVVVSNARADATGTYVFADAIRFGNGMGSVDRGTGVSGYPREDENCRYWIQASLGQGQPASLYDGANADESDSWSTPGKYSAEMNRQEAGTVFDRIHISFHSNAGGGRGVLGLITGDATANQATLAQICGSTVNSELVALGVPPLEVAWSNRSTVTYTGGYGEITDSYFNSEMDATIIEVAFHDSVDDAKLLRDPKARTAVGRAAMHAVVKYMNQFAGTPLVYLPEPPTALRARGSVDGSVTLEWTAPVSQAGSGAPAGYVVYRSSDGRGFGSPLVLGNVTRTTLTGLTAGADVYFRVAATNAGGESMPSETVGCRPAERPAQMKALFVNAFDRYDRTLNLRQNVVRQAWAAPAATGSIERVLPARNNSFDYVVPHGKALAAAGVAFDSCQNEAVAAGQIWLGEYDFVVWACGQESTGDETFSASEQAKISEYRSGGGNLFLSGSEIGWDLDRASGPTAADRTFYNSQLKADLASDAADDSGSYTAVAVAGSIFAGRANGLVDDGSRGIYPVQAPDVLTPTGAGVKAALTYQGVASGAAAIQYDGSAGGGKVVYFGFPFETVASSTLRSQYMADIVAFFTTADTLVAAGSAWKYDDSGTDRGTAWTAPAFDDSAWPGGPAQLGFGDGDEATLVAAVPSRITTYFRRQFTVTDPRKYGSLRLRLLRDDGAVVWLNGREVARSNMPATGDITWSTQALTAIGGADESTFVTLELDPRDLRTGSNALAVEIHQSGTTSSDLSFDLELSGVLQGPSTLVSAGSVWKYRDTGVAPSADWTTVAYDDSAWPSGPARLGYGGDGERTLVGFGGNAANVFRTTWFRRTFTVADATASDALRVTLQRDDGCVVWLNGRELLRDNLPSGAILPTTFATTAISGADETAWRSFLVPADSLVTGANVLAVEMHQNAANSSDLGFDLHVGALPQPAASFSAWVTRLFGSDASNAALTGPSADPDADGAPNSLEYALGTSVSEPASHPALDATVENGALILRFTRNALAADLTLALQSSTDLIGPWTDLARSVNGDPMVPLLGAMEVAESPTGSVRSVEVRLSPAEGATQQFFRLRAFP